MAPAIRRSVAKDQGFRCSIDRCQLNCLTAQRQWLQARGPRCVDVGGVRVFRGTILVRRGPDESGRTLPHHIGSTPTATPRRNSNCYPQHAWPGAKRDGGCQYRAHHDVSKVLISPPNAPPGTPRGIGTGYFVSMHGSGRFLTLPEKSVLRHQA